jgi:hypothetical protein
MVDTLISTAQALLSSACCRKPSVTVTNSVRYCDSGILKADTPYV